MSNLKYKCTIVSFIWLMVCSVISVIHGMINAIQWIGNETRYDVTILETYRNSISLLKREFIWSDNICRCPKLRLKFDYIIMGVADKFHSRELRLMINPSSYVRKYSLKHGEKLQYFRDKKKCKRRKVKTDNNYHLPPVF